MAYFKRRISLDDIHMEGGDMVVIILLNGDKLFVHADGAFERYDEDGKRVYGRRGA